LSNRLAFTNRKRLKAMHVGIDKILQKLLRGESDANIRFDEVCHLLQAKGFRMRTSGSHHIFTKSGVMERLNLQR